MAGRARAVNCEPPPLVDGGVTARRSRAPRLRLLTAVALVAAAAPAQRPVQVTQDLANFWDQTYFEVRKDLRGRYPKHYWPEDPRTATPTRRTRPS